MRRLPRPPIAFLLVPSLLFAGCGGRSSRRASAGSTVDVNEGDGGVRLLPSGTTLGETTEVCPANPAIPGGAICSHLTVRCPGVEDLGVTVAVTTPAGGSGATVLLHDGGGGTTFFRHAQLASMLTGKGLRVIQIAWDSGWELSAMAHSALVAACRPATILRWAFAGPHGGSRTAGFCALGHSGGSGALGYALAHYGLGDTLDYAVLSAGPYQFSGLDQGK